ncbi:MAG TPA: aspartyl protease family protein [Polyangia bacterium]|nr:aspartyl protease family protein [Polyangia bacterium]
MKHPLWVVVLASVAASCGSSSETKYEVTGMLGIPSSTIVGANLIFVDAAVNGSPEQTPFGVLIDSGSPVVLIDPEMFGLPTPATANDVQKNVDLGLIRDGYVVATIQQIPAVQLSAAMMDTIGFGGILGGNVMRQFSVQLDYAAPSGHGFCLGCTSGARDDVESPGAAVPFMLKGGAHGPLVLNSMVMPTVTTPATRIPVTVTIDGTDYPFILDTGASEVSVRGSVFDAITSDGRAVLKDFPITTVMGDSGASVTRTRTITVGGETVMDAPVMTIPGDDLLNGISAEVDRSGKTQIDGLLGGSYLRNFLVTVDYPGGQLHLQSYNTQTWVDEFKRVGVGLAQTPATANHWYAFGVVYPGTDAYNQNLKVGEEVISIDGTPLDGLDPVTADALLNGTVGTTKTIVYAASDNATPVSVDVKVDDLIPSP